MRLLFISLRDNTSLPSVLPLDVIQYIGKLFYQPDANINALNLPERVISPFWEQLYCDFKEKFSFLST